MMNFPEFLVEMSVHDAKKILGLDDNFTSDQLRKAFKKAASKNHPDKGGSTEMMKQVNNANDLLQKNIGHKSASTKVDWNAINQKYWDLSQIILKDLIQNFKLDAYTKHFRSVFGEEFQGAHTYIFPEKQTRSTAYHVSVKFEWTNLDRSKVFELQLTVSLNDLMGTGGLASPGTTYRIGVSTFAYKNGRKVKITKRDYDHTGKKSVFDKPDTVFPTKKLTTTKQSKFKKSDMLSALRAELKAEKGGDNWFIKLKDGRLLAVYRGIFNRLGYWTVNGIWDESPSGLTKKKDANVKVPFMSLPESEETLDLFRKASKLDSKSAVKLVIDVYQRHVQ